MFGEPGIETCIVFIFERLTRWTDATHLEGNANMDSFLSNDI